MKGGLLERLKKTFQEKTEGVYVVTDDGVYLESGTIVIDDDGDSTLESVGTYDVFGEDEGDERRVSTIAVNPPGLHC